MLSERPLDPEDLGMPQMPSNRLAIALRPLVCWVSDDPRSFWPGLCVWSSSTSTCLLGPKLVEGGSVPHSCQEGDLKGIARG